MNDFRKQPEQKRIERTLHKATFGAGCFWAAEAVFRQVKGIASTAVGFEGGAEVVEIEYDQSQVSYEDLLTVFWSNHDPTTRNRQGADVGPQYRSVVFFHTPEQQAMALALKERLQRSGRYKRTIVTEITPASHFSRAEEYHQQYYEKRRLSSRWSK